MTTIPGLGNSWGSHCLLLHPLCSAGAQGLFVQGKLGSFSKLASFSKLLLSVRGCPSLWYLLVDVIASKKSFRCLQQLSYLPTGKAVMAGFHQTSILPWSSCHSHETVLVGFGWKENAPVPTWIHSVFSLWPEALVPWANPSVALSNCSARLLSAPAAALYRRQCNQSCYHACFPPRAFFNTLLRNQQFFSFVLPTPSVFSLQVAKSNLEGN